MPVRRNPLQVIKEAKQIAKDHGCFVAEKTTKRGTKYMVFRCAYPSNVFLGHRGTPESLRSFVCKVTNFH